MTRIQQLRDLLERVSSATGPSFEFDRAISHEFNGVGPKIPYVPPTYTASTDAALTLVGRCLPGVQITTSWAGRDGCAARAFVEGRVLGECERDDQHLALALMAVMLEALIARHEEGRGK